MPFRLFFRTLFRTAVLLLGLTLAGAPGPWAQEAPAPPPGQAPALEPAEPDLPPPPPVAAPEGRALRLGIVHAQPRLCAGQEPAQRDLRVLRLAFGLNRTPPQRLDWPWYLGPVAATGGGRNDIALRSPALWDKAWPALAGTDARPGPAAAWRQAVLEHVPGLVPAPSATGAAFRVRDGDPLLPSRLGGSEWLPDYADLSEEALPICRHWPVGVDYRPSEGRVTYVLRRASPGRAPAFVLTGYRQSSALWADYSAGRLDAALIEGADLGPEAVLRGQAWGQEVGTQQIVVRVQDALAKSLAPEARWLLSEAVNRLELAQMAPRGSFRPARAFMEPVLALPRAADAGAFPWDSRDARRRWLEQPRDVLRLRMVALSHPFLEPLAQRLVGQWQKSLELPAVAQGVEADQLWRDWARGSIDLMLDVVDLDDGSLQDLWRDSLGRALTAKDAGPATWEAELRTTLPYLPLLTNLHWVVSPGGPSVVQQICPGCTIGGAP